MRRLPAVLGFLVLTSACSTKTNIIQAPGTIAVDVKTLDFGTVLAGRTSSASFQVQNQGREAGRVLVKLTGPFALAAGTDLGNLGPGAIASVGLEFHPTDDTAAAGSATVSVEGIDTQVTLSLTGQGTRPTIHTESVIDFGEVPIGQTTHHTLTVESTSLVTLAVRVAVTGGDSAAFVAGSPSLLLAPGASATLDVAFTPQLLDAQGATLELTPCEHCDAVQVPLRGSGQTQDLQVEPNQIAFGHVSLDMTARREIRLINTQTQPAWVNSVRLIAGPDSPFALEDVPATPFLLSDMPVTIHVAFTPTTTMTYEAAVVVEGASKVVRIGLSGVGGDGGLTIAPDQVSLGLVPAGPAVKTTVHVGDAATGAPLTLTGAQIQGDVDNVFTATSSLLPASLRGAGLDVTVTFRTTIPGIHSASLSLAVTDGTTDFSAEVPLSGLAAAGGSCQLQVLPAQVRMGLLGVGRTATRTIHLSNTGTTPCTVDSFRMDGSGSFRLVDAPAQSQDIAAGGRLDVNVSYQPTAASVALENASLHFFKASSAAPEVEVPLTGLGSELDFGPLAPAAFGTVPVGVSALLALDLDNASGPLVQLTHQSLDGPSALTLLLPAASSVPSGETTTAQLSFRPVAAGPYEGLLQLDVANALEPIIVPISGVAEQKPCGDACTKPTASCPGDRTTWVLRDLMLPGAAAAPAGRKASCAWTVASAPAGSTAVPETPGSCVTGFRPDVRGDYQMQLSVSDDGGGLQSCTTTVHADTLPAIWAEATWDPAQTVDLHLFHPSAGSANQPGTWRGGPFDCWKGNVAPSWDSMGTDDDPRLDPGPPGGPEIVRLKTASQTHDYTLGVHRPTSRSDVTHVQVKLYCSGNLVTTASTDLNAAYQAQVLGTIHMSADGSCSFNSQPRTLTVTP